MDDCIKACDYTFTFHYVSIKTDELVLIKSKLVAFTFHYVSIKTLYSEDCSLYNSHLHSTMYLLKLVSFSHMTNGNLFTFHYVSIKTQI